LLCIIIFRYRRSAARAGKRRRCGDGAADGGVGTGTILFQHQPSTELKYKVKNIKKKKKFFGKLDGKVSAGMSTLI
jgi:hypothetical protein